MKMSLAMKKSHKRVAFLTIYALTSYCALFVLYQLFIEDFQLTKYTHFRGDPHRFNQNFYWFMKTGYLRPDKSGIWSNRDLFPEDSNDDRIVNQLMFMKANFSPKKNKTIYLNSMWSFMEPNFATLFNECPVYQCTITRNSRQADAVLFRDSLDENERENKNQIWIFYSLESPRTIYLDSTPFTNLVNWTATYKHFSDIVAPYAKFVYYDLNVTRKPVTKNYATGRTKQVLWFVSNCYADNNRLEYARELRKYISTDIYGACGDKKCFNTDTFNCFDHLKKDYKFYLSFENTNCRDYITEKFFGNALQRDFLPIVMGADREDYKRQAPDHSYIHVDDFSSPKELAMYLHELDLNDELYNEYFEWKECGEFINTHFWCRLCTMLHSDYNVKYNLSFETYFGNDCVTNWTPEKH